MIDDTRTAAPERTPARDTGAMLLAAGGLAAAFGAGPASLHSGAGRARRRSRRRDSAAFTTFCRGR